MNCKQVRNNLIFYYYKELDHNQMEQIREHLAVCSSCRKEYNKLALVLDYAQQEKELKATEDVYQNVLNKLTTTRSKSIIYFVQTIAAAAAIVVAIFLGTLLGRTYVQKSYVATQQQEKYQDYDSLVETFTTFDESVYIVFDN